MSKILFWIFIGPYYIIFKIFTLPLSLILKLFFLYRSKNTFSNFQSKTGNKIKYANKTCNNCGIQKPANEMFKTMKSFKSGTSNTSISWFRTIWGIGVGDKGAERQFKKFILSPSKRVYTRNREVWVCSKSCAKALR